MTVTASNYPLKKNDFYQTEPWAVDAVIRALKTLGVWRDGTVWEPAAGNHAMVKPIYDAGAKIVMTSDIANYRHPHSFMFDFLGEGDKVLPIAGFDLISNPPYGPSNRLAHRFAEKALLRCDGYVALLLTAKFDFGSTRTHLFRDCRRFIAKVALLDRVSWEGNGKTGTEDHAWYIWGPKTLGNVEFSMMYERNLAKVCEVA